MLQALFPLPVIVAHRFAATRLSFTKCHNRTLRAFPLENPKAVAAASRLPNCSVSAATLVDWQLRAPGCPAKVVELVRTDVADLFSGIRTRKPVLVGSDPVGRRSLMQSATGIASIAGLSD
jgi:hypothetical protein